MSQHIIIPKTQNHKSQLSELFIPHAIRGIVGVLPAIDFQHKLPSHACEVYDVWSDRDLPLEFDAAEPMRTQPIPKSAFGIGHVGSQLFGVIENHALSRLALGFPPREPPSPSGEKVERMPPAHRITFAL